MQMQQPEQGDQEHDAYNAAYSGSHGPKQQQKIYPQKRKRPSKYFAMSDLEERIEQAVQQKKQQRLEHLVIRRYWLDIDGDNVGYGLARESIALLSIGLLLLIAGGIIAFLAHGINPIVVVLFIIGMALLAINAAYYSSETGYYVVDARGRPTRFLQKNISMYTSGLSRKQYIQRVQGQSAKHE